MTNRRTDCDSLANRKPGSRWFSELLVLSREVRPPPFPHSPLDSTACSGQRRRIGKYRLSDVKNSQVNSETDQQTLKEQRR